MKILIIEDQIDLLHSIQDALSQENFNCETADTKKKAEYKIYTFEYDILIVDINLPDGSGLEIVKQMKRLNSRVGIMIISARNAIDQKIEGLELGADDYITKPFDMAELIARVKSLIRRRLFNGEETVNFGNITINTSKREVYVDEQLVELTKSEYQILLFFFSNPNRVISKETLAEHIWGDHMDISDSYDFIYSHMKNLRKKIVSKNVDDPIKVIYGIGYKFETNQ